MGRRLGVLRPWRISFGGSERPGDTATPYRLGECYVPLIEQTSHDREATRHGLCKSSHRSACRKLPI